MNLPNDQRSSFAELLLVLIKIDVNIFAAFYSSMLCAVWHHGFVFAAVGWNRLFVNQTDYLIPQDFYCDVNSISISLCVM